MRFLHACGDVSCVCRASIGMSRFSPRMWRCFWQIHRHRRSGGVFSTHVEMFPNRLLIGHAASCFLHACGDVSKCDTFACIPEKFSPRMWRCFVRLQSINRDVKVFSTHVEMFLRSKAKTNDTSRFLHACGDVSAKAEQAKGDEKFSPRMWRCFSVGSKGVSHR